MRIRVPGTTLTCARSRNLRPCLPQACAEAARATNYAAAATRSSSARRVSTILAGSMALVRLGRIAGHLGEPLSSAPSTAPSPSSPRLCQRCMPAPIRTFEERTHILAAVRCCMLVSLLLLLLWLATGMGCALFRARPNKRKK